ncbi:hypothetical protein GF342_05460 [Candidatus Woesearchaeota archaeon]|nr:hypothetical protein [Candidatus Woesearchaeota archaeon]
MNRYSWMLVFVLCVFITTAQDVVMFYGKGCPHCSAASDFFDKANVTNLVRFEVYFNQSNREVFQDFANRYQVGIQGVPTIFIGDQVFVGFSPRIAQNLEDKLESCRNESCVSPFTYVNGHTSAVVDDSSPSEISTSHALTIPAVLSAAAIDAINPCAFAVLIILMATVLAIQKRRRALFAGLAFSAAVFISYVLMGVGLYTAITSAGITHTLYIILAILAILLGLFNLKDFLWYGKWFVMEVPRSWRPKLQSIIKSVTSAPGAFLIGFVVSLFLLPCTSGPYIVILGLLAKTATRNTAFAYLLLYNIIFVLPMIVITLAMYWGLTTAEQAEQWRQKKLKILHLIAGVLLILLGVAMLFGVYFGYV